MTDLPPIAKWSRLAGSLALLVYCLVVVCYLLPARGATKPLHEFVRPLAVFLGLHQNWAVFSPAVADRSRFVLAVVQPENGVAQLVPLSRQDLVPWPGKCDLERFRKWSEERVIVSPLVQREALRYLRSTYCSDRPCRITLQTVSQMSKPLSGAADPPLNRVDPLVWEAGYVRPER